MGNTIGIKTTLVVLMAVLVLFFLVCPYTAFAEDLSINLYVDGGEIEGLTPNESDIVSVAVTEGEITLPVPTKLGYNFLGWTKTQNIEDTDYVTAVNGDEITSSLNLYTNYSFVEPNLIEHLTDYNDVYTPDKIHTMSVAVDHPLSEQAEISYQWFKDDTLIENASRNELAVNNICDSGQYKCIVTFDCFGNIRTLTSSEVTVEIRKATPSAPIHPILEGVYDPEKTLSDYQLDDNYYWIDETVIPNCTVRQYSAEYRLGENYNSVSVDITLIIAKAKQVISAPNVQAVYDKNPHSISATATAGSITYSDNNSLTDIGLVTVTITASETDDYLKATATAVLEVVPKPITAVWNTVSFVYNGQVQLPVYSLSESEDDLILSFDKEPINAGQYELVASINNSNYVLTNNTLNVTIKKQSVAIVWSEGEFVYNGQEQMPEYDAQSAEGVILKLTAENIPIDAGEHTVTLILDEEYAVNYVVTEYEHTYSIQKADVDLSNAVFDDLTVVYDGENHRPTIVGLPEFVEIEYNGEFADPDVYTITASFTLNNANYNDLDPLTATLTILRKTFTADWYEIECPRGVAPDVNVSLQKVDNLDGLYSKNSGKFNYLFGFKVVFSDEEEYTDNVIIRINYKDANLDTLVISVDNSVNEQIVTYVFKNDMLEITIDNFDNTYVVTERTQSIYWIIIPIGIICIAVCIIICLVTKNHPIPKENTENEDNTKQKVE